MTYQMVGLEDVSAMAYLKVKRSYMGILSEWSSFRNPDSIPRRITMFALNVQGSQNTEEMRDTAYLARLGQHRLLRQQTDPLLSLPSLMPLLQ